MPLDPQALGHILEGVVERDPLTDRYRIMSQGPNGAEYQDVQDLLALFEGKEVRFTLASFEGLARLAQMVEDAGGGQGSRHHARGPAGCDIQRHTTRLISRL